MTGRSEKPLISIVMTGRNDNQNGDFELRAEYAIRHNAALLEKYGIEYEWIWVEWNSLPGRPLFGAAVRRMVRNFRGYVVPASVHNHLCDNPHIGVMQFFGKNAGIRRAAGEWVLSMNADTYLTDEVLSQLAAGSLRKDTLYLATRVDFPPSLLKTPPPSYPIDDIAGRPVVRIDRIMLPDAYGAAGDFTLLNRETFFKLGAHYEGIRFSNHHIDTLLGHQHKSMGGVFVVIGRVFHADHADSWNNTIAGAFKNHHHGYNYNCRKIRIPYRNAPNWGLADYEESAIAGNFLELNPPSGQEVRLSMPENIVVPPELDDIARFEDEFAIALDVIEKKSLRVVIYGLGIQTKPLLVSKCDRIKIIGYIDDNMKKATDFPYPLMTWEEAAAAGFDVVLIASFFWAEALTAKALSHVHAGMILPSPQR